MSNLFRRFAPCLLLTALPALADSGIEEVVISALRIDTSMQDSGSSVTIIDESMMTARGLTFVGDAIASSSGVTLNQNGPFGGSASIRIRGASSDQTLVLVDGVPANDTTSPGGGFNFGAVDTFDIERIEILKGPQSTLWGSDAIGGVINIVSKPATEALTGNVSAEAGSYNTRRLTGQVSGSNHVGDFRLSYADFSSDGISKADEDDGNREDDGFDSETLSLRGGINFGENARLNVLYRNTEAETEFDSFGPVTGVQDGDEVSHTDNTTLQANLHFDLFDGKLENILTYGNTDIERENVSSGASSFSADGERDLLRYQGTFGISDNQKLSFGYEKEESESSSSDSEIDGLFALYRVQPTENVTLSLGLRRDDHDTYGTETTGSVTTAWQVNQNWLLRGSWGEGFKAPTIFQTTFFCCGATAANPDLKPEYSEAFDLGFTYRFDKGSIGVTWFDQNTEDLINFAFAIGGYENINEVDSQGVELELDYNFAEQWLLQASLTYLDSEESTGANRARLPNKTADVSLSWQPNDRSQTTLVAIHNGEEDDSRGTVNSWTRFDLSSKYRINKNVELFARIENLFDKDYQQIFGYGTPERSGYLGVRYAM